MARDLGIKANEEKPYVFISYNSEDQERLYGIAQALELYGLHIWYDNGIKAISPEAWKAQISKHIRGAELGHLGCMEKLAVCYYRGLGTQQNYKEAAFWYRKAADRGSPEGMCGLANCCRNGFGVEKNEALSQELYQKAARAGNRDARKELHDQGIEG